MIYFDNAATTKVDQDVLNAYLEVLTKYYANPSSPHMFAKEVENIYLKAKKQILACLSLNDAYKVVMTSGATEANNLAIIGYVLMHKNNGDHIICSNIEHSSISNAFEYLKEEHGIKVDYVDVDEKGHVNLNKLKELINDKTLLVSIMGVNNEIGSKNDIKAIADIIKSANSKCKFHCDAVQAINKVNIDLKYCDLITISSHKIHGLKGCGALILKNDITLHSLNFGGGQEWGIRSGTNDVANAVALAVALRKGKQNFEINFKHVKALHDYLYDYLYNHVNDYELNSNKDDSPYILNFSLKNKKASVVVEFLSMNGIMVSTASACSSKKESFSKTVKNLNKDKQIYQNTIRVSFDIKNTLDEVKQFITLLNQAIGGIRS